MILATLDFNSGKMNEHAGKAPRQEIYDSAASGVYVQLNELIET